MEKSAETAMVFYKSAPSAAAATPLNQKQYKIGVAYIVRNQNTNFQYNWSISTFLFEKSAKTEFLRRFGSILAALSASISHS